MVLYLKKKIIIIFIILAFISLVISTRQIFGNISMDQLIFFIILDDGITGTDTSIFEKYLINLIIIPLKYIILILFIAILIDKIEFTKKIIRYLFIPSLIVFLFFLLDKNINLSALKQFFKKDNFSEYFVEIDKNLIEASKLKKKNLLFIYLESLETGYSTTYEFDPNAPLNSFFNNKFLNIHQSHGVGWTIAGMIASQCGVPLSPFMSNNKFKNFNSGLLKNTTCLSDILDEHGYYKEFIVGPHLKFSGMDKFYGTHKYDKMMGMKELIEYQNLLPDTLKETNGWGGGVNDDQLFEIAYNRIKEINKTENHFLYTLITTDGHSPNGMLSPRCDIKDKKISGVPQFISVKHCTNLALVNFLKKLEEDKILDNTSVIVMGDHLFMNPPEYRKYFKKNRYVYLNFINKNDEIKINRYDINHYDVYPLALKLSLNLDFEKLHLGRSLSLKISEIDDHFETISKGKLNYKNSKPYLALY